MKTLLRIPIIILLFAGVVTIPLSAAPKAWSGAADTFWSTAGNWSPAGAPGAGDNVTFTNDGSAINPFNLGGAVNNVVDAGFAGSINSLSYMNTNGFHNTSLINPLQVIGTSSSDVAFVTDDGSPAVLFIGSGQADGTTASVYATIVGSSLIVSNGAANLSVMQINGTDADGYRATLDLTGLDSFSCTVSNVHVGIDTGAASTRPHGTLLLAKTNVITASNISVADVFNNGSSRLCFLKLGQSNVVNVDTLRIGLKKMRGTMSFNSGLTAPTVKFRNAAGIGRESAWEIGDINGAGGSSSQTFGTVDLSGGTVDALVDRITVGRGQQADGQGDGTGTLTFGGGLIDANVVELGIQQFAGRSVGSGTLNVNNDAGVGPASLTVNSNIVMAVQSPGNTDAVGSTAVLNISGGTVTVAGDIIDGGGRSTVNINNGGKLDLKPSGDATPGDISLDVLNLGSGTITNYGALSVSNINLVAPATQFTVYPGQTIAPIAIGIIGTLSVAGDLTLRGTVSLDISKSSGLVSNDTLAVTGTLDLGGTLTVALSGSDSLVAGDKFTIFAAPTIANSFTTLNLPPLDAGLIWLNKISVDGSIQVAPANEPPTFLTQPLPAAITCFTNARMTFRPAVESSLPIDYRWRINSSDVPGATNPTVSVAALGLSPGNTYTLKLQASNSLGSAESDPVTLTVVTNPPAVFTLYSDTFSDAGSVALNGRQPDASSGCATWLAGSGMFVTNGALPYPGHWENYLPLTPQTGHVYTLSVDISPLSGGGNWLAMGFVNSPNVSSGGFYVGATGWMLATGNRQNIQTFDLGFGGARSFGPEWFFDASGYGTFSIVLDTTTGDASSGWTLYFVEDGVLLGDTPYRTYAANPANLYVGIGGSDGVTGLFDNFLVSDSVVGPTAPTTPSILPALVEIYSNAPATFTATTAGACPISYQWRLGTQDIPGATNSTLVISNVQPSQAGSIFVVVSNSFGSGTNTVPATLTVLADPVQAYTLYQDTFTGTGGSNLDGRLPELSSSAQAWTANPAMIVDSNQLFAPPGGPNQAVYLPFQPQPGHVYVLSVDLNPLTGGANWVDFGFTPDADVNTLAPDIGGGPWMLQRADRSGSQAFALGYGSVGSGDGGNATGYTTWKIVLDTTTGDTNANTGWTAVFVEALPNSFGKVIAKNTYGANPTVFFVALGNGASVGVSANIDNFRLTDSIAPLNIAKVAGDVVVTWTGGILLEAPALTGPWTTNNVTSPYTFTPSDPQKFFRVQFQ